MNESVDVSLIDVVLVSLVLLSVLVVVWLSAFVYYRRQERKKE